MVYFDMKRFFGNIAFPLCVFHVKIQTCPESHFLHKTKRKCVREGDVSAEGVLRGRFDPQMEIHFTIAEVQGDQGVEPGQQQDIGDADISACNIDGYHGITENIFCFADRLHQFKHAGKFVTQSSIQLISLVALGTDRLKVFIGDI